MVKTARVDLEELIIGGLLRNAPSTVFNDGSLRYDPEREAGLNDIVFAEILEPIPAGCSVKNASTLERLVLGREADLELEYLGVRSGLCLGAVGNRYASPFLIGGLQHPITEISNGVVQGGVLVDSLFGVNCLGFVNAGIPPQERVRVLVHGVLVDRNARRWNLRRLPRYPCVPGLTTEDRRSRQIVVGGFATGVGKTLCVRALARELRSRGYRVTMEKKSGTACFRDSLACLLDRDVRLPTGGEAPCRFRVQRRQPEAFDFVDTLGVVSDVSLPTLDFVRETVAFSLQYLRSCPADIHLVELGDGLGHSRNLALLQDRTFQALTDVLVYNPLPYPEAVLHFRSFLRGIEWPETKPLFLSGPLANEDEYDMVREEIEHRCQLKVLPCARPGPMGWEPSAEDLAGHVLRSLGLSEEAMPAESARCTGVR
ncbi:MAG TPA: hypothetical protein P5300_04890 [Acidobacteriota bacterium]|nr:hypothetical protein [Acidobacteriota bacterium]